MPENIDESLLKLSGKLRFLGLVKSVFEEHEF